MNILKKLEKNFVVSCQAEGDDPFNSPELLSLFAKAAQMGGAGGIRCEGIENIKEIKKTVSLPLIGLLKSKFNDGTVRITGTFEDVKALNDVGCDIIAIDGTLRQRDGLDGPSFIGEIKKRYPQIIVMADISTVEEALACEIAGADCISTTLNGYTPYTYSNSNEPCYDLIKKILVELKIPLFAEGRINSPKEARRAIELGAFAVVTGTAITRPRVVTKWFIDEINNI